MNEELLLKIQELLHANDNHDKLNKLFDDYHPRDIASLLHLLNEQERNEIYEIVDEEKIADVLEFLEEEEAAIYIQEMSFTQGADVLSEMETDDAVDVLNELESEEDKEDYLNKLEDEERDVLDYLSQHEENTAGSIMSTNFIKINSGTDVKDATKILGYEATETEIIDPIFVVDGDKLVGTVKLQDLIVARTPLQIDAIMDKSFITGEVGEDITSITEKISNYDIYALPILDNEKLVGIVTMDDALDAKTEEINEDYASLAAVSEDEDEKPVWKNILARLPWLLALLIISLLISNVTEVFEDVIKKVTVLWFFNTMILDMAGNAGTQNLAVAIRHLGRNELDTPKKSFKYILRELLVLFLNGFLLGLLCFGVTFAFIKVFKFDADINPIITSLVIALSLWINIVFTGILGSIIPLIMDKLHIDPALASGPLITTLNDILALVVYFGLAMLFLPLMVA